MFGPLVSHSPQPSTVGIKANQGSNNSALERRGKEWASGLPQEVFWENIKVWYLPIPNCLKSKAAFAFTLQKLHISFNPYQKSLLFEESGSRSRFLMIKSWKLYSYTHSSLEEAASPSERTSRKRNIKHICGPFGLPWKGIRIGI